jgi:hypothetical protein
MEVARGIVEHAIGEKWTGNLFPFLRKTSAILMRSHSAVLAGKKAVREGKESFPR